MDRTFQPKTFRSFFLAAAFLATSCGGEEAPADVEVGCRLNSDCAAGEVCDDGLCVADDSCVGEDCPCLQDAECAAGQGCEVSSGECFDLECLQDNDCALGEVCASGLCATDTDADRDRDGVPDTEDLCPDDQNADQEDNDGDGRGDACDDDDDNDAVPDSLDNCPQAHNPQQGDADGDGVGNGCDEDTPAIGVTGSLDFSALPGADTGAARVFITGRLEAATIDATGNFSIDEALTEPGTFSLRVEWPSFALLVEDFVAEDGVAVVELPALFMTPTDARVRAEGRVSLAGGETQGGVLVEARANGTLMNTTATASDGSFLLELTPVDHALVFTTPGYVTLEVEAVFDPLGGFIVDGVPLAEAALSLAPVPSAAVSGLVSSGLGELDDWPNRAFAVLSGTESDVRRIEPVVNAEGGKGQFQFTGLAPGGYVLDISAQGHRPARLDLELLQGENTASEQVLVPEVEEAPVVMRGLVCRGACGGPADHAGIVVRASVGVNPAGIAISDAEGAFALTTSGLDHTLELQAEGFIAQTVNAQWSEVEERFFVGDVPLSEVAFELVQVPTATLSARVASDQGARNDWPNIAFATLTAEGQRRVVGVDNADEGRGQLQFVALAPGPYTLVVAAQGHLPLSRQVDLAEGQNNLGVLEVEAEADDSAVILLGQVRLQGEDEDGDHSGVLVRATVEGNPVTTSQTDTDGVFAFSASRQTHTLTFSRANYLQRQVEAEWDEVQLRFEVGGQPLRGIIIALSLQAQSDLDFDGVIDSLDNCPRSPNSAQENIDADDLGDACDSDTDGDGLVDGLDNCPRSFNPMQEDAAGFGRGVVCALGSIERPIEVGCGINLQRIDTRQRADRLQGSCGGAQAPEVVYALGIAEGEQWSIDIDAPFTRVVYLINEVGQEVDCVIGGRADFGAGLPAGQYTLVVDGFSGPENAGPLAVSITALTACALSFEAQEILAVTSPNALKLADLNGDGAQDAIMPNHGSGTVSVALSGANGDFSGALQSHTVGDLSLNIEVSDLTGDGHIDIATSDFNSGTVTVLVGRGDGDFEAAQTFEVGPNPFEMVARDFDKDGHTDLFVALSGTTSGRLLMGEAQGSFSLGQEVAIGQRPVLVESADFNQDGHLDLVTLNLGDPVPADSSIAVFFGDAEGGFALHETYNSGLAFGLELAELNGDGHVDIVALSSAGNKVNTMLGRADGGFEPHVSHPVGDRPDALAMGDLDADGDLDIVTSNRESDDLSLLLGDGTGDFAPQIEFSQGRDASMVSITDADRDGALDLIYSSFSQPDDETTIFLLKNDGKGNFTAEAVGVAASEVSEFQVRDIDADGVTDIAIAAPAGLSVFSGGLSGHFAPRRTLQLDGIASAFFYRDIDSDGIEDVLTVNQTSQSVSVLMGEGGGVFSSVSPVPVGDGPKDAAVADLDADGDLDIATANLGFIQENNTVTVLKGDGLGGFSERTDHSVGQGPIAIVALDVNGDTLPDLVTCNSGSDDLSLLLADGVGGFAAQQRFPVGATPTALLSGDLNGDQISDLLVLNQDGQSISVLLASDGALAPQEVIELGVTPRAFVAQDINNDGRLDILASSFSGVVVILHGDGLGGFNEAQRVEAGTGSFGIALADLDGDTAIDLVVANSRQDNVSVFMGDGQGHYTQRTDFETDHRTEVDGGRPEVVLIRDVNSDGRADLVVLNVGADSVSLLAGDGAGGFSAARHFPIGPEPRGLIVEDIDSDGLLDFMTAAFDNVLSIVEARSYFARGARFAQAPLSPCPSQSLPLSSDSSFLARPERPCRVDRLELDLSTQLPQGSAMALVSPLGRGVRLFTLPRPGLNRPESIPALARFDGVSLGGLWPLDTLGVNLEANDARLVVNSYPDDPFSEEAPAPACISGIDQPSELDFVCRMEQGSLDATLDSSTDEDVFLLQGAFDGAFLRGQVVEISVEAPPGSALFVDVRAHRASRPLGLAAEVEPGRWTLNFEVPAIFSGRYLAVHVRGAAVDLNYSLDFAASRP